MSNIALTDWLTFVPAGEIRQQRAYIDLPAFSYAATGSVGDPSVIVAQFNFSASRNFYLLTRPTKPTDVNYGLCIRYRVGETVYRYKLWEDPLFVLSSATPLYNKQLIKKNFVLEVWNFATVAPVQATSVRMLSSVRSVPTDYRAIADYALAVGAEFTDLGNTNVYSYPTANLVVDLNPSVLAVGAFASWPEAVTGAVFGSGDCLQDTRFNGKKYVQTTGAAWITGVVPNSGSVGAAQYTIFMMCAKWAEVLSTYEYLYNDASGDWLSIADVGTGMCVQAGATLVGGTMTMDLEEEVIIEAQLQHTPSASSIKKNDDVAEDGDLSGFSSNVDTQWFVGGGHYGYTKANIARILVYNTILSAADRLAVNQYLANQYLGAFALPLTFNSGGPWLDNV